MQKSKEQMIAWVVQLVRSYGEEGVAIQDLFQKFGTQFKDEVSNNEHVKNDVWQAFMTREDAVLASPAEAVILKSLELGDAMAMGYGVRKVSIKKTIVPAPIPRPSFPASANGRTGNQFRQPEISISPTKTNDPNSFSTLPRTTEQQRYGPVRANTFSQSQANGLQASGSQVSGTGKQYSLAAGISDKSQNEQLSEVRPSLLATNYPFSLHKGAIPENIRPMSYRRESEDIGTYRNSHHDLTRNYTTGFAQESVQAQNGTRPSEARTSTIGAIASPALSMGAGYQQLSQPLNKIRRRGKALVTEPDPLDAVAEPKRPRGRPRVPKVEVPATSDENHTEELPNPIPKKRGRPKGRTKHKTPPPEILPAETLEPADNADTGLRSSRRQPKPRQFFVPDQESTIEPQTRPEISSRSTRTAVFISYEDMQREEDDKKRKAGIPGVYLNPLGVTEGRPGRQRKSMILLFKSNKLQDHEWLENQKGTWIEVLDEKRKATHAAVEAEASRIAAESRPTKRRRNQQATNDGSTKQSPRPQDVNEAQSAVPAISPHGKIISQSEPHSAESSEHILSQPMIGIESHTISTGSLGSSSLQSHLATTNTTPHRPGVQSTRPFTQVLPPIANLDLSANHYPQSMTQVYPPPGNRSDSHASYSQPSQTLSGPNLLQSKMQHQPIPSQDRPHSIQASGDPCLTPYHKSAIDLGLITDYQSPYAGQSRILVDPRHSISRSPAQTPISASSSQHGQSNCRPQSPWPAGFLPPDSPQEPRSRAQSTWPAGFLPPDASLPVPNLLPPINDSLFPRHNLATGFDLASGFRAKTPNVPPPLGESRPPSSIPWHQQVGITQAHYSPSGISSDGISRLSTSQFLHHTQDQHGSPGHPRATVLGPQYNQFPSVAGPNGRLPPYDPTRMSNPEYRGQTPIDPIPRDHNATAQGFRHPGLETGYMSGTYGAHTQEGVGSIHPPTSSHIPSGITSNPNKRKRSAPKPKGLSDPSPIPTTTPIPASPNQLPQHVPSKANPSNIDLIDEEGLKKAEAVDLGDVLARMPAVYNQVLGNLVLSVDKTRLDFRPAVENADTSVWTTQIARLAENPIVSMPGSNPMELRIKVKCDDESVVLHRFLISSSKAAHQTASDMRGKLVNARIFVQMSIVQKQTAASEDAAYIAARPWKCDKCGSRFKNKEGIKYHHTKAQTTCNPDFKPEDVKPRPFVTPRKKKAKPLNSTRSKKPRSDENDGSTSDGDSDDSVFEWAEQVAGLREVAKKPRSKSAAKSQSGKFYKSLANERPQLEDLIQELRNSKSLLEETSKIPSLEPPLPVIVSEETRDQCAMDIVIGLLKANNHMMPADRGLWFAFVASWLKLYSTLDLLPEFKLCAKAVDSLIERGAVQKVGFDFVDGKSRNVTRNILFEHGADLAEADIARLKDCIKSKHPGFYVPPAFAPPNDILKRLEAIGKPSLAIQGSAALQMDEIYGSDGEEGSQDSSDDDFLPVEGEYELGQDPMGLLLDSDDDASDDPSYLDLDLDKSQFDPLHSQQMSAVNTGRALPSKTNPKSIQKMTRRERHQQDLQNTSQSPAWNVQPPTAQNPITGAWDTPSKPKRVIVKRDRLPEPITYIQELTGAWCIRPFGHGVNPIFTRPNKRTVGNPNLKYYLQSIEQGYRPVIHPNKPAMLPSVPSRFLLEKNAKKAGTERQLSLESGKDGVPPLGMSKRAYRYHTRQQKDHNISRWTGQPKRGYRSLTPDPMDSIMANADGVSELDILNHFEPKPLDPKIGREKNPGLDSFPRRPATPGLPHYFSDESAGLWTVLQPFVPASRAKNTKFQWLNDTAFTLETLPYEDLIEDDEIPPSPVIQPKHKKQKRVDVGIRKGLKNKWVFGRQHTATPDDLAGTHRDVKLAAEQLGIQMTNYDMNIRKKRQRFKEGSLPADEEARLTMGVVIVRALLGGLEFVIDWVVVGSLFPDVSVNFLRKFWLNVFAKKKALVEKLTKDFQEAFIPAYRKGQVQSLDYDHVVDYDWKALLDWALSKITSNVAQNEAFDLPGSMADLKYQYELTPEPANHYWAEQYLYPHAAVYQRMNLANSVPFACPVEEVTPSHDIDNHMLARSWCRATAATPDTQWSSKAANKLLSRLPSTTIIKARESLLADRIISKNKRLRTSGRVYNLPETFNVAFNRASKIITEKQFREAYIFKCELDRHIREGGTGLPISWGVDEGSVLAITNLQAQGRIHVQKYNVPANKFGLTEGGYETRGIDKAKYRFQMEVHPTENYLFNEEIFEGLGGISDPPGIGERGEIPVWRGITGQVIEPMWKKILVGVAGAMALRSGIDAEGLERVFRPGMEVWELDMLIKWGVGKGVWKLCEVDRMLGVEEGTNRREGLGLGGWTTEEWWWVVLGRVLVEGE